MRGYLLTALVVLSSALLVYGQSDTVRSDVERVRRTALEQLTQQFSVTRPQIDIRVDQLEAEIPSHQAFRIQFSERWDIPRGREQVRILTRQSSDRWEKSGWALLFISRYDSVLVSRRTLRTDDEVTPDEIHAAWVNVTRLHARPLTPDRYRSLRADDRCYARQHIREGEVIRRDAIRQSYAARAGDSLMMIYERNGIAANLRCKVRQSGFPGEVVRLSCPSTGALYRAELSEDGTATWMETL